MKGSFRSVVFITSYILLLAGAVLYLSFPEIASYLFAVGAAGVAVSYLTTSVKDFTLRQRRLHNFNVLASLLLIVASGLMFSGERAWIICLTIATIFILYTSFVDTKDKKIQ